MKPNAVHNTAPAYPADSADAAPDGMPPGYRRTEVGVIPGDWNAVLLDSIARVTSGKRLPAGYSLTDSETPHPYIRVSDIYQGGVFPQSIKYVPVAASRQISQYRIFKEDLFISVAGTLGLVGKIPPELDGANLTENADRITDIECARDYLLYVLLSDMVQGLIDTIRTVGAQPKLALTRIRKFCIPLPPTVEEQRAIATALSDADALIESLDRLIAKKRAIKQAAMQQLLTGQTRLPGFTGEWETKRLGDVAEIDPENLGSSTPPTFTFNYISLEQVAQGRLLGWSVEGFSSAPSRARRVLRTGDILVSTVRPNLQSHFFFDGSIPNAVCSTGFAVIRCDRRSAHPGYVYAHMFGTEVNGQIDKIIAGSNYPAISSGDVRRLNLPFPSFEEQTAIATALSDMDAEIEVLERRRDKARQIKQGMMQQLLTGRVRLVKSSESQASAC